MQVWPQFMYLPQAMRLGKARAGRVQSPRPCHALQRRLTVFQVAVKITSTYMYLVILIKKNVSKTYLYISWLELRTHFQLA